MTNNEFVTVPVMLDFNQDEVVGEMRIKRSSLPDSPDFVFSIGFKMLDGGKYELACVSVVSDENYIGYLTGQRSRNHD